MTVEVRPVTGREWDDVAAVFATTGDSGHRWCQWFQQRTLQPAPARSAGCGR